MKIADQSSKYFKTSRSLISFSVVAAFMCACSGEVPNSEMSKRDLEYTLLFKFCTFDMVRQDNSQGKFLLGKRVLVLSFENEQCASNLREHLKKNSLNQNGDFSQNYRVVGILKKNKTHYIIQKTNNLEYNLAI
jgi:hypothetical protein